MTKRGNEKKLWSKPTLNVLVRTKPEDAVLKGCKNFGGSAAIQQHDACYTGACSKLCDGMITS